MLMQTKHKNKITKQVNVTLVKIVVVVMWRLTILLELSSSFTTVIHPSSLVFTTEAPPPILFLLVCKLHLSRSRSSPPLALN